MFILNFWLKSEIFEKNKQKIEKRIADEGLPGRKVSSDPTL
jgi:hypothetical protein